MCKITENVPCNSINCNILVNFSGKFLPIRSKKTFGEKVSQISALWIELDVNGLAASGVGRFTPLISLRYTLSTGSGIV